MWKPSSPPFLVDLLLPPDLPHPRRRKALPFHPLFGEFPANEVFTAGKFHTPSPPSSISRIADAKSSRTYRGHIADIVLLVGGRRFVSPTCRHREVADLSRHCEPWFDLGFLLCHSFLVKNIYNVHFVVGDKSSICCCGICFFCFFFAMLNGIKLKRKNERVCVCVFFPDLVS